jgi:hypothetical protein
MLMTPRMPELRLRVSVAAYQVQLSAREFLTGGFAEPVQCKLAYRLAARPSLITSCLPTI